MTTTAVETPTRTTASDLTADQRAILVAVAATEYGRATYQDIATALGWTEQRAERVAASLPCGVTGSYTRTVHIRGIALRPPTGQTLAAEARQYGDQQMRLIEGEIE